MVDLAQFESLEFETSLPTMQRIIETQGRELGALAGPSVHGAAQLAKLGTGYSWLGHLQRTGAQPASSSSMGAFDEYIGALKEIGPLASVWTDTARKLGDANNDPSKLANLVLQAQMNSIVSIYGRVVRQTPVVGWVVELAVLAVAVGQIIWSENHTADPGSPPLQLDPAEDTKRGRELLAMARTDDWTSLFMPEHNASGPTFFREEKVNYQSGFQGGRFWLANEQGIVNKQGEGLIPGGGLARQWQFRGKQASLGLTGLDRTLRWLRVPIAAGAGFEEYTTYGLEYFRPSFTQIGQLLWNRATTPGPDMFKLHVAPLRDAWNYYWRAFVAGFNQMVTAGNEGAALLTVNVLLGGGITFPDWPHYMSGKVVDEVPFKYTDNLSYAPKETGDVKCLGGSPPDSGPHCFRERVPMIGGAGMVWVTRRGATMRYLDNLEDAQHAMLNTLEIAYLVGTEPGLLTPAMRTHFNANRELLLKRADVMHVELDRVPEGSYKQAVLEAQAKNPGLKLALATQKAPEILTPRFPWGTGGLPIKQAPPTTAFEKPTTALVPQGEGEGNGNGLGGLLMLALLLKR